jgi:hypothetical protein
MWSQQPNTPPKSSADTHKKEIISKGRKDKGMKHKGRKHKGRKHGHRRHMTRQTIWIEQVHSDLFCFLLALVGGRIT